MKFLDALAKFITALLIISVIGLVALGVIYLKNTYVTDSHSLEIFQSKEEGRETIKTKAIKSGLSTAISATTGKDVDVNKYIKENIPEEDAKFINKILDEKVDVETVTEIAQDYVENGTVSKETIKELEDTLTEEEKDKVVELAKEYGEDFLDYIK